MWRLPLQCRPIVGLAAVATLLAVALSGCSSHACKLGGFPTDSTEVFFDLRQVGLTPSPELKFTMCSHGSCETRLRPSDPPYISGAEVAAGEQLENVSLTIEDSKRTTLVKTAPATGPFQADDYFPNGEGCPPLEFQRWLAVGADGSLTPEAPQQLPLGPK